MISVMALLDRNYIKQPQWAAAMLWWRNQSPVHHFSGYFHHISSHRHYKMSARNVGSVCLYRTNSWHTIPCTSKLTSVSILHRNKLLCLLQAGRSHVVIHNDLWKDSECLTFLLSVLVHTDAILIVSAHQLAYKAEILTQSIINSILCQNLMA